MRCQVRKKSTSVAKMHRIQRFMIFYSDLHAKRDLRNQLEKSFPSKYFSNTIPDDFRLKVGGKRSTIVVKRLLIKGALSRSFSVILQC